jgi:hypothetical protein
MSERESCSLSLDCFYLVLIGFNPGFGLAVDQQNHNHHSDYRNGGCPPIDFIIQNLVKTDHLPQLKMNVIIMSYRLTPMVTHFLTL